MGPSAYLSGFSFVLIGVFCAFIKWNPFIISDVLLSRLNTNPSLESIVANSWNELIKSPQLSFNRIAVG